MQTEQIKPFAGLDGILPYVRNSRGLNTRENLTSVRNHRSRERKQYIALKKEATERSLVNRVDSSLLRDKLTSVSVHLTSVRREHRKSKR